MVWKNYSLYSFVIPFIICSGIFLAETAWFQAHHSITYDETLYLSLSNRSVLAGKLNPDFANVGVAPLPMMLTYFPPLWLEPAPDREETWGGTLFDPEFIKAPRVMNSVLIGLPLIAIVMFWLTVRNGPLAGTLGGGLVALPPSMIAHGGLATTDLSFVLFSLISLFIVGWMANQPSLKRAAIAGVAIGVTLAAKYSGLFLFPVAGLLLALHLIDLTSFRAAWTSIFQIAVRYTALLAVAGVVCWGCHLFASINPLTSSPYGELDDTSPWVQILGRGPVTEKIVTFCYEKINRPASIDGILFQVQHSREGHGAYLMGEISSDGWWYYFPCAFAFKSTPVELLLSCLIFVSVTFSLKFPWRNFLSSGTSKQSMNLGTLVLIGLLMNSHINIGQRYMLLIYPILIMLSLDFLWNRFSLSRRHLIIVTTLCLVSQATSSILIGPHYLGYFNAFAGGPEHGRWLLSDSNNDWGQDLPVLQEFQKTNPEPMILWYFGTALPAAYGVQAENLEEFPESIEDFTYAALSISNLIGPYGPTKDPADPFAQVRGIEPLEFLGTSIVILDLRDPDVRGKLQTAIQKYEKIARENPDHPLPRW